MPIELGLGCSSAHLGRTLLRNQETAAPVADTPGRAELISYFLVSIESPRGDSLVLKEQTLSFAR